MGAGRRRDSRDPSRQTGCPPGSASATPLVRSGNRTSPQASACAGRRRTPSPRLEKGGPQPPWPRSLILTSWSTGSITGFRGSRRLRQIFSGEASWKTLSVAALAIARVCGCGDKSRPRHPRTRRRLAGGGRTLGAVHCDCIQMKRYSVTPFEVARRTN